MGRPRYFLLRGDLDQRRWLPQQAWSTRRICVIVTQIVILAVLLGYIAAVLAQDSRPRFEVGGNSDVRVGQTTSLTCNVVRGAESPFFVWVKDGKVISGQTEKHLSLNSVTKEDAGYYQCGTPDPSSYGQRFQLRVHAPGDQVAPPSILQVDLPVLGRPFSLHCLFPVGFVKSEKTVYSWYRDSLEVKDQTSETLYFDSVKEGDEGWYTCTAREGPPQTTSPQSLPIDVLPLVPPQVRIKPPGPVVKGVRGETLTLTCEVARAYPDVPADGYSWSYLPSPSGPERPLDGRESTLTLGPLTLEDRGQYVCQARNDQKREYFNLNLTGHASVTMDVVYLDNLTLTPDLEVNEGDRVTLICGVDSRPTAQLAWTVRGQEVRHVTDNLDHYVITRAACSDSGSYTCGASNTELPGRDRHAMVQLLVHCKPVPTSSTAEAEVSASFHFPLPDWTPMVVVHPGGHDVISVGQDCSYNVSSAFQSRCLQPWCDSIRHRLSFTLTNVTEKDEGEYVCLEEGPLRKPIPNCGMRLHVKKCVTVSTPSAHLSEVSIALITCVCLVALLAGTAFGIRRYGLFSRVRHWIKINRRGRLSDEERPMLESQSNEEEGGLTAIEKKSNIFERLYENGKVYVFPPLVQPKEKTAADTEEVNKEQKEHNVKDLLRSTLLNPMDLPSFILHNTRLTKEENVILVLNRRLGIVVLIVNTAASLKDLESAKKAARHLVEARDKVRQKLQGLVTSKTVHAVLSLPCLKRNNIDELRESIQEDVELLAGDDPKDFKEWAEHQETERKREMWLSDRQNEDPPDVVYKTVASRFLKLVPIYDPGIRPMSPDPVESLLLTPAQMEVRDSTARLLHISGPPGSGKTMLLVQKARQWLAEGKAVVLAVGGQFFDIKLAEIDRAVRREDISSSIHLCRTVQEIQRAIKVRRGMYLNVEVCVIIDSLSDVSFLEALLPDVRSRRIASVWIAGWENLSAPTDFSKKALGLGWETIRLLDCIRCTDNTVELLNLLGHRVFPPIPSCSVPRDQDIPAWRVVDHSLHPDHVNTVPSCVQCKKEISAALPSMKQQLEWNYWIALHTGDLSIFVNSEPVQQAAKFFGIPVSYDINTYLRYETVLASSASRQVKSSSDFTPFRARVIDGLDKEGRPTMHLLRVEDFRGMEREGVILVHWDFRDNDPGCQSQGERATRLEEHRRQWIQAASCSTGQVILLLLSPSPARSLLRLPEGGSP